ncbi:MAG: hypothetical protein ACKOA8_06370, partial [Deltaproteobacteria bacterium]
MWDDKKSKGTEEIVRDTAVVAEPPTSAGSQSLVSVDELLPTNLFLLPVAHTTLFPGMMVPLILPEGKLTKTLEKVMEQGGVVGVILNRDPEAGTVAAGPTTSISGLQVEG